jgi:hypothetical protein
VVPRRGVKAAEHTESPVVTAMDGGNAGNAGSNCQHSGRYSSTDELLTDAAARRNLGLNHQLMNYSNQPE